MAVYAIFATWMHTSATFISFFSHPLLFTNYRYIALYVLCTSKSQRKSINNQRSNTAQGNNTERLQARKTSPKCINSISILPVKTQAPLLHIWFNFIRLMAKIKEDFGSFFAATACTWHSCYVCSQTNSNIYRPVPDIDGLVRASWLRVCGTDSNMAPCN